MPIQLKKKMYPDQLIPRSLRVVWPGDTAVDVEKSDIFQWCEHGEEEGLVMKPGMTPDIIELSLLNNIAFNKVAPDVASLFSGDLTAPFMAFRYGYISSPIDNIAKELKIRLFKHDRQGQRLLTREALDFFLTEDFYTDLPLQYFAGKFMDSILGKENSEVVREGEFRPMSLPYVLGSHILARSFHARKNPK